MPLTPPDQPHQQASVVMLESPRDAAKRAIVYRRRTREEPHERILRITGMVGAILLHLLFLFGAILGSAYDEGPLPPPKGTVLQLRLIDNKPVPPPPPPPLGALPKQHGPTHHGSAAHAVRTHVEPSTAAAVAAVADQPQSTPTPPTVQPPVVAKTPTSAAPKKTRVAAPLPPTTIPKPAPTAELKPVPVGMPPPSVSLQAPKVPQPVPPKFQPEPVRKPQAEGTQAMPPPASLAMPVVPAQSPPQETPPHIVVDVAPVQQAPATVIASFAKVETPAAPPAPAMQPVPIPAQAAPTVNLQPSPTTIVAEASREAPHIEAPTVQADVEPQLATVPLPSKNSVAQEQKPAAPVVAVNTSNAVLAPATLRPELSATTTPSTSTTKSAAASSPSPSTPSAQPAGSSAAQNASTSANSSANDKADNSAANQAGNDVSTSPNASSQGSDSAKPGEPNGSSASSSSAGKPGGEPSLTQGQGAVPNGEGQGSGTPGSPNGSYIQLKPRGDTSVMSHELPDRRHHTTVFDQYWTPKGESSVDTALRHAVEKTTVAHTFNLPRGVRVECTAMPLLPMTLLGCHNPDPPAAPLKPEIYKRLNLPTTSKAVPLVPAPATSQAAKAPVQLDNSVQCAEARVTGGLMPPDCADATPVQTSHLPASASSGSWVPASDQFH